MLDIKTQIHSVDVYGYETEAPYAQIFDCPALSVRSLKHQDLVLIRVYDTNDEDVVSEVRVSREDILSLADLVKNEGL